MSHTISEELKHHIPFTLLGAVTGILLLIPARNIPEDMAYRIFYIFHPLHVFLSALATASMFEKHREKCPNACVHLIGLFAVGYVGAIGISTISDSLIPFLGEKLLNMPHSEAHIGFIEEWWIVNPMAFLGILVAYFRPNTKGSHTGHVLTSTWASLFHILMAGAVAVNPVFLVLVFLLLFFAVWVPCCLSDIIFPLLFTGPRANEQK